MTDTTAATAPATIAEAARRVADRGESAPRRARDPVNQPMVSNWVEALGDTNPVYTDPEVAAASAHGGLVAPPAMAQVWTMYGLAGRRRADDPLGAMTAILDDAGYTSVVATDCEQSYHRYLRPGEHLAMTSRLEDVVGPKRTALGEGYFVTTRSTWRVGDEPVAEMLFRVLKFRPADSGPAPAGGSPSDARPAAAVGHQAAEPRTDVIRPAVSRDTAFFWTGTAAGELRIQRCGECGRLRHPPGPMCPDCGATRLDYVASAGRGEVYSYVVHHHPPVPGRQPPFVVALVGLDEGVRMLGELVGIAADDVRIGQRVEVTFQRVDDELTLPAWRPEHRYERRPAP